MGVGLEGYDEVWTVVKSRMGVSDCVLGSGVMQCVDERICDRVLGSLTWSLVRTGFHSSSSVGNVVFLMCVIIHGRR